MLFLRFSASILRIRSAGAHFRRETRTEMQLLFPQLITTMIFSSLGRTIACIRIKAAPAPPAVCRHWVPCRKRWNTLRVGEQRSIAAALRWLKNPNMLLLGPQAVMDFIMKNHATYLPMHIQLLPRQLCSFSFYAKTRIDTNGNECAGSVRSKPQKSRRLYG